MDKKRKRRNFSDGEIEFIRKSYVEDGKYVCDIAKATGRDSSTVRARLRMAGIKSLRNKNSSRPSADITGQKFGRLTVVGKSQRVNNKGHRAYWNTVCDCGNRSIAQKSSLVHGNTRSCGCLMHKVFFTYKGEKFTQADWGRRLGITRERVRQLFNEGKLEWYIDKYIVKYSLNHE